MKREAHRHGPLTDLTQPSSSWRELLERLQEADRSGGLPAVASHLDAHGTLKPEEAALLGEKLVGASPSVVVTLCPLIGEALKGEGYAEKRLALAMAVGGVAQFSPDDRIRCAVIGMLTMWQGDPVIAAGLERMIDATPFDPKEELSLKELRAKMRIAYEQSGLTLEQIGIRMGHAEKGAAQAVRQLMARSDNPSFGHLQSFASACGYSFSGLLNLSLSGQS